MSESQFVKSFASIGDSDSSLRVFLMGIGDISNMSRSSSNCCIIGSEIELTATSKGSTIGCERDPVEIIGCEREPVEARLRALLAFLTLGLLFDGGEAPGFGLAPG